jgi:hypothetical protein
MLDCHFLQNVRALALLMSSLRDDASHPRACQRHTASNSSGVSDGHAGRGSLAATRLVYTVYPS